MMSSQTDNLTELLKPFGLSTEEIEVYIFLLKQGTKSALEISKALNIGRTKVYRIVEDLIERRFVNRSIDEYGAKFEANEPKSLESVLREKEAELEELKTKSPLIFEKLESLIPQTLGKTKILYYRGVEGLKQVTWNSLKTKDTFRIFEIRDMSAFLDFGFAEKVRMEFAKRNIKVKELSNQKEIPAFTNVPEHIKVWDIRYIDPKELSMDIEIIMYNDVYAMYSYEKDEIFCIEIYNQKFTNMQKQIFDFMWLHAKKMKILNDRGEAKLEE